MRNILLWIAVAYAAISCSTINCPLNNMVVSTYKLKGETTQLNNRLLTVIAHIDNGNDSVLLNQITAIDSFILPMSYTQPVDVFYFQVTNEDKVTFYDTIKVSKDNYEHFESIECPATYFHKITGILHTNYAIDSIKINNSNVQYEPSPAHFHIYFKKHLY